jgi:hypothetical protein
MSPILYAGWTVTVAFLPTFCLRLFSFDISPMAGIDYADPKFGNRPNVDHRELER